MIQLKIKRLKRYITPTLEKRYFWLAVVVLGATTIFWTLLSVSIHQSNADQIVNPYLFADSSTFSGAQLPGAHTFLLKWPLFWLVGMLGVSNLTLALSTLLAVGLTVSLLAFLICRIEKRPLIAGTLFLALAAALLLVPAQPYAGALLPVNMAMLTTRNLEYAVYLLSLLCIARASSYTSRWFIGGSALLALLIASDKLFMSLSIGGALLGLLVYAYAQKWHLVTLAARWLLASSLATLLAVLAIGLLNATHATHIVSEGGTAGPYGIISDVKTGATAVAYAGAGVLTNMGANPAFNATTLATIPSTALSRLVGPSGLSYVVMLVVFVAAVWALARLVMANFKKKKPKYIVYDIWNSLALMLALTSVAAIGLFVVSDHYYAVDGRYLTITMFALFIGLATYTRKRKWPPLTVVVIGIVLMASMLLSLPDVLHTSSQSHAANKPYQARNELILKLLSRHHVDIVVGDYWRVLPLALQSKSRQPTTPLGDCLHPRKILTSKQWQPDLHNHSFAYILPLEKGATDFPACNLRSAIEQFGRPNANVITAGSAREPTEMLLFYDRGIQAAPKHNIARNLAATSPAIVPLADLSSTGCKSTTLMQFVAHQDDDLLFMNPDLDNSIAAGDCVRTVYLTAGDSGQDTFYWLSRQQGAEAAYARMLDLKGPWIRRIAQLSTGQVVTVSTPRENPMVSLIFMHLPDGNLQGQGYTVTGQQSLAKLLHNQVTRIETVNKRGTYTAAQLAAALTELMKLYRPAEIHTQANDHSGQFPDHSDHLATNAFVHQAYNAYNLQSGGNLTVPIINYLGYPVRDQSENLAGKDLERKQDIFFTYAGFDGAICKTAVTICTKTLTYHSYLRRQYSE
ncbi:MAG: hypothetical protein JWN82_439 [Candidatus Saccharibacteria bacterium]|nr:hypothetical protein [Candidatus Saccharibacteria bacterium]